MATLVMMGCGRCKTHFAVFVPKVVQYERLARAGFWPVDGADWRVEAERLDAEEKANGELEAAAQLTQMTGSTLVQMRGNYCLCPVCGTATDPFPIDRLQPGTDAPEVANIFEDLPF